MAGMTEMVGKVRERQELVVGAAADIRALLKDIHRVHEEFYKAGNVIEARTRDLDAAYKQAVAEVRPAWRWRFLDRVLTTFAGGILALVLKDFLERWQP